MAVLHSLWVWGAGFAWMAVADLITAILLLLRVPYTWIHPRVSGKMFGQVMALSGVKLDVTFDPEFDRTRPSVYCANHTNLFDAHVACAIIPHAFGGLMNDWQFKIPIYGWMMRMSQGIGVDRKKKPAEILMHMSREARDRARRGISVLTFPEAHRTRDGHVQPFRQGVFRMARFAKMPVVPFAVRGMFAINHRGSWLFRPGRVQVYVGPTVETAGLSEKQLQALAQRMQRQISHFVEEGEWRVEPDGQQDTTMSASGGADRPAKDPADGRPAVGADAKRA